MTTIINPKWSTQGLFFFSDESIQNTAASYVTRRFCGLADVLQLKWLPVVERTELAVVKLAWMSINQSNWLIVPPDGNTSTNTNAWRFPGSNTCAKKITLMEHLHVHQRCSIIGHKIAEQLANTKSKKTKSFLFDNAFARTFLYISFLLLFAIQTTSLSSLFYNNYLE